MERQQNLTNASSMISVFLIFQTNEIAHESDSCNPDQEPILVSINTSSVESELEGKDLNRKVSWIIIRCRLL